MGGTKNHDRYIIEDDYDCEYRYDDQISTMQFNVGDETGKSDLYQLTPFRKSLAPSIRISYMVLPKELMEKYRKGRKCLL